MLKNMIQIKGHGDIQNTSILQMLFKCYDKSNVVKLKVFEMWRKYSHGLKILWSEMLQSHFSNLRLASKGSIY